MDEGAPASRPPRGVLGRLLSLAPIWAWALLASLAGGSLSLGSYTFLYANGLSYLSNDPRACVNCHVMQEVYDGWSHGSHKNVAVCNDCHTPHNLVGKYAVKAINGFKHSSAFTLGGFPEPIHITPFDREIALANCMECHEELVTPLHAEAADGVDCLRCHAGVGHGR